MKVKHFFAVAVAGLMFASCAKNETTGNGGENPADGAMVTIELVNPATRADLPDEDGVGAENTISNLEFFVFTSGGKLDLYKAVTSTGKTHKFVIPTPGADMEFMVAVNQTIGDPTAMTGWSAVAEADQYDFVRNLLSSATTYERYEKGEAGKGNTLTAPTSFAMSGFTSQSVTAPSSTNESPNTNVAMTIHRLVSKIEAPLEKSSGVEVTVDDEEFVDLLGLDDKVQISSKEWALIGYVLINGVDKTDAFNNWNADGIEANAWDTWNADANKTNLISDFDGSEMYSKVYGGTSMSDMFLTAGTVYAYENQPAEDAADNLYWDRNTVYSFILKGTFTVKYEADPVGAPGVLTTAPEQVRYWRANLIPDDDHRVLRNAIYRMTVEGVNTIGYATPKDAEEEVVPKKGNASVTIKLDIAKWRVKFSGVVI
ncbi:hypothetical protein LJC45_02480 [Alistipes sp. OttesenSCG-928-B03]|nr:hypothetical protein [Alistipes sp. OttesenSCG-928-B03]